MNNKAQKRVEAMKIRNDLSFNTQNNCKICEKVIELLSKINVGTMFVYASMGSEVDTRAICEEMFDRVEIFVPYTAQNFMRPVRVLQKSDLKNDADKLGNIYPDDHPAVMMRIAPPRDFSVTIVPMLAFDKSLRRLGYGGGYYDRFLTASKSVKIGLAFDEQEMNGIDFEEHDVPLDVIITPTHVIGGINGK